MFSSFKRLAKFKHLFVLLLLLFSRSLAAQQLTDTLQIKTVEIVASKIVEKEDAGQTSTKIDSIAMLNSLTANLSELISQNTPIFIKEYGRGAMATASFRGTAPSHTQVDWNGLELNSPMLGMVDFSMIPVYFTDDVSLLHGSASMQNNSGALGGSIQLKNKTNWDNRFSGKAITGFGSYSTFDEMLQLNFGNKKIQSQTRAFYNSSKNNFSFLNKFIADIDPETGNYIYPKQKNSNADYQNYGLLQEIYLHPAWQDYLTIRYWHQHNERSIPQLLTNEMAENANINRQNEDANRAVLEWKRFTVKGILNLNSGINYQLSGFRLKTKVSGTDDQTVIDSRSKSLSWNNKLSYDYQFNETLSLKTSITLNAHSVDSENLLRNNETNGYNQNRWESSLFLHLSKSLNKKTNATILVREEVIDGNAVAFLPLAGLEFRPFAKSDFYIKTSAARNYHQPTLNDLYYIPGGNPDLKPEEGNMFDLGSSGSFTIHKALVNYAISGYVSGIDNWIIWLPTFQGYWEPYNMKRVNTSGLEANISMKGKINDFDFQLNSNYAYTRSINRDNPRNWADESIGKQLPFIPLHSVNLSANISKSSYYFDWIWSYYSKRYTTSSNDKETKLEQLYPYFMNNINLGKTLNFNQYKLNIELKVMNLFNEDYRTVLQRPMPGRNYSILFRLDF